MVKKFLKKEVNKKRGGGNSFRRAGTAAVAWRWALSGLAQVIAWSGCAPAHHEKTCSQGRMNIIIKGLNQNN